MQKIKIMRFLDEFIKLARPKFTLTELDGLVKSNKTCPCLYLGWTCARCSYSKDLNCKEGTAWFKLLSQFESKVNPTKDVGLWTRRLTRIRDCVFFALLLEVKADYKGVRSDTFLNTGGVVRLPNKYFGESICQPNELSTLPRDSTLPVQPTIF